MGIFQSLKIPNRQFVVYNLHRNFMTTLACVMSFFKCLLSCSIPSPAVSFSTPTPPICSMFPRHKLRLPLMLTVRTAKIMLLVRWASASAPIKRLPTPIACVFRPFTFTRAILSYLCTFPRAILLGAVSLARGWLATFQAKTGYSWPPSCQPSAFIRAIGIGGLLFHSVGWVKFRTAIQTLSSNFHSCAHSFIIPQGVVGCNLR